MVAALVAGARMVGVEGERRGKAAAAALEVLERSFERTKSLAGPVAVVAAVAAGRGRLEAAAVVAKVYQS